MILYSHHSPSHQILWDKYFYPSLQKYYLTSPSNRYESVIGKQHTPTGSFDDPGFNLNDTDRVEYIISIIEKGEKFIFSDVDIVFYDEFADELSKVLDSFDIVGQSDNMNWFEICGGFFAVNPSPRMLQFWKSVHHEMKFCGHHNYQLAFMKCRRMYSDLRMAVLDERYWSVHRCGRGIWRPDMPIEVPTKIVMHHANYTVGVPSKMLLLDKVKKLYEDNNANTSTILPSVSTLS